jgi:hypothetical protein
MTKLKTLKDIQEYCTDNDGVVDSLRAEAIKWIKEIYKIQPDKDEPVTFIKHFFNISEGDLK